MKDATIFALLLLVFALCAIIAVLDTSRMAVVNGTFAPEFSNVNWRWAYLRPASSDEILDSCLVTEHKFTLSSEVPDEKTPCRITFSKLSVEPSLRLSPGQTLELQISAGFQPNHTEQHEEAIREAIARLDSAGLTLPDSLWEARKRQNGTDGR